jgi:hypothetical protein
MAYSRQDLLDRMVSVRNGDNKALADILRAQLDGDTRAELELVGLRARSTFIEDFLAAGIDSRLSSTAGAGTANAALTTVAGAMSGTATLKSASDDGTNAQNCSSVTFDQLNWKASQGGLVFEVYCAIDDVSEAYLFIGFTDTISTTVECPISISGTTAASDATDAAGIMYDIDATTDKFYVGGVSNNTDATPVANFVSAPSDATYFTARVEIDTTGKCTGYINGAKIGEVAAALRTTIGLTPAIVIGNRSANQVVLTVDYLAVQQNR